MIPYVYDSEIDEWVDEPGNAVWTDEDGHYALTDLRATGYRLEVADGEEHLGEFYENSATLAGATTVPLPAGTNRAGVDVQLAERPHVAGQVTDSLGAAVPDVRVTLLAWNDFWAEWESADGVDPVVTGADGRYDLPRLRAGTYRLEFADDTGVHDTQYFDGAEDVADATDVTVAAGVSRTDVDVTLVAAGEPGVIRNRSLPTVSGQPAVGGSSPPPPAGGRPAPASTSTTSGSSAAARCPARPTSPTRRPRPTVTRPWRCGSPPAATATPPASRPPPTPLPSAACRRSPTARSRSSAGSRWWAARSPPPRAPGRPAPASPTATSGSVGGTPVEGATASTYTPTSLDVGQTGDGHRDRRPRRLQPGHRDLAPDRRGRPPAAGERRRPRR